MQYSEADLKNILDSDFILNPKAFGPGCRNDDTVNCMIICWCLGLEPIDVIGDIKVRHNWSPEQDAAVMEVVERVEPYLEGWGPRGTMASMAYAINY
jgi:hypothetical protein